MNVKYQNSDFVVGERSQKLSTAVEEYVKKVLQEGTLDETGNVLKVDAEITTLDMEREEGKKPEFIHATYYIEELDCEVEFDLLKFLNNKNLKKSTGVGKINWDVVESLDGAETKVLVLIKQVDGGHIVFLTPSPCIFDEFQGL